MQKGKTWKEKIVTYFTYDMFIGFGKENSQRFVVFISVAHRPTISARSLYSLPMYLKAGRKIFAYVHFEIYNLR